MPGSPRQTPTSGFQVPRTGGFSTRLVVGTAFLTLLVLTVLPISQVISGDPRDTHRILAIEAVLPPPEPPPPEPPPPPEEERQEEVRDLEMPPPPISLSQLEASLNPGMGGAGIAGVDFDAFGMGPDAASDMQIFSLRDLDERPRRLTTVTPQFPPEFGVNGWVGEVRARILIDEQGNVSVMEIISSTHREAVQPVRQALARWRFEPPRRDGQAVRASYIQPIPYDFSR